MDYLLPETPRAVSATGVSHVSNRGENIAYLTLFFPSKLIAHIHVNWLAPVKVRQTLIGGSNRMIVYDDLEASEKIKVYDKGITVSGDPADEYQMRIGYRSGDVWTPHLGTREALAFEASEFVHCVMTGARPASDGQTGMRIVAMLEAAERSMKEQGRPVEISDQIAKQEQPEWSHSLI
jgi:predicted dehydrogenase